jgi:hypothetical protein
MFSKICGPKGYRYQPVGKSKALAMASMLGLVYLTYYPFARFFRPIYPWNMASSNLFFSFVTAPFTIESCPELQHSLEYPRVKFDYGSDEMHQNVSYSFPKPSKIRKVNDFSFLQRHNQSAIKNIVWVNIESARSDVYPFDYESEFAKRVLTEQALREKNIMPFIDEFFKKGAYVQNAKSTSSYTIKSFLGIFCSMYPYPSNFVSEHMLQYYRQCLPRLLTQFGYSTKFFQTSSDFDHQREILGRAGFDYSSRFEIDIGHTKFEGQKEEITSWGYSDEIMLPDVMEFVDKQVQDGAPFMVSMITTTNHHPFYTPSWWKKKVFTKPELDRGATFDYTKDYLSANNFQDQFLKNLTQLFADRDLLKNTLFIFNGDHAISLGEHGLQEQAQIPYDSPFKVPIFLYTEHPDWKPILENQIIHGDRSTLDLVPTVLDILNPHFRWDTELDYGYEGSSLLRPPKTKPLLTFSNPGFSSVQIRENGLKMLYQPQLCGFPVYDLKEDPLELNPLNLNTYKNGKYRYWKRYAQQQLQLMLEDIRSKYRPFE